MHNSYLSRLPRPLPRESKNPFVRDAAEEFLRTKAAKEKKTQDAYFCVLVGNEHGTKPALGIALAANFQNRRLRTVTTTKSRSGS